MRKYIVTCVLISVLLLAGCNIGTSVESQLSKVLGEMTSAEENYRVAQSNLSDLEKSEQALFNETMELTQGQTTELEAKIVELETFYEKRLALFNEEEASIKKAKESIRGFDALLKKAEGELKGEIEELKEAMNKRYELHAQFSVEYKKLMDLQKELYEILPEKKVELLDLQRKVDEVNEQNEVVKSAIDLFNESTIVVNSLKNKVIVNTKEE